jgi:thiosulfate/3-mercaptopyruvate sulfurtransferase
VINLVDNSWLAEHLSDPQTRVIDPRPRVRYLQGHVPKAVNLPLAEVFDRESLALFPDEKLAEVFGKIGVDFDSNVVLYDSYDGQSAAMLAWLLEYLGHSRVMILSTYFEYWVKQGGQILYRPVPVEPKTFSKKPGARTRAFMNEVLQKGDSKLLDLRSEDEFRGKTSSEPRAGHIPGSVSLPWTELIEAENHLLKSSQVLRETLTARGVNPSDQVITYCSNGPRAAIGYLALQQLGFDNVQVYDGSFHEWARRLSLPLELGDIKTPTVVPAASPCAVQDLPGISPTE